MPEIELIVVEDGNVLEVSGHAHVRVDVYHHLVSQPPSSGINKIILTPGVARPNGKEPPAMDFVLTDDQEVVVAITGADAAGNPVPVTFDAGTLTATSSIPTVLSTTVDETADTVTVTAEGPEETGVVITVEGDVGGVSYTGSLTIDVTASPLAGIGLTPGTPTTKAAAPAPAPTTTTPPPVEAPVNVTAPAVPEVTNPPPAGA